MRGVWTAESGTDRDYRICRMLARYVLCKPRHCFSAQSEADLINVDDDDVACIAKAWSQLRMFAMRPKKPVPTRLTSHVLIPFAKHCLELEELSLTINAATPDNYEEKLGDGMCNRKLWKLGVNDSSIDNPGRVAAFISDIFPEVRKIVVSIPDGDPEGKKRKWEEVERLIPVFAAVRKQEANRKT